MPISNILKKYTNPSESGSFSGLSGFLKANKNKLGLFHLLLIVYFNLY